MPKKFGNNTKAVDARARKEAVKQAEKERKEREAEDEYWKDDDKHRVRKQQRKDEKEKKKSDQAGRRAANKAAYDEEMEGLKSAKMQQAPKVTRAEIATQLQKKSNEKPAPEVLQNEPPLEENLNRVMVLEEHARSVDEAIQILSVKDEVGDKHPEKRMKAAYQAFENANLPQIKTENPNLRLSQLKQLLKKEWMKSPENPMNQLHDSYNTK